MKLKQQVKALVVMGQTVSRRPGHLHKPKGDPEMGKVLSEIPQGHAASKRRTFQISCMDVFRLLVVSNIGRKNERASAIHASRETRWTCHTRVRSSWRVVCPLSLT